MWKERLFIEVASGTNMKGEQRTSRLLSLPLFFMSDVQTLVQREMCADNLHPSLPISVACGFLLFYVPC